jgi:hypothetical protein
VEVRVTAKETTMADVPQNSPQSRPDMREILSFEATFLAQIRTIHSQI